MRVLIADDSAVVRRILGDALARNGYESVAHATGDEAWKALSRGGFHIAVLGWRLPGLSGGAICRRLQTHAGLQGVYAIILTGRNALAEFDEALAAGANDCIVKPFNEGELLARLAVAERILRTQSDLAESQRLATIGSLTAGVAHEINTPMQYVADNARFLQESFGQLSRFFARLDEWRSARRGGVSGEDGSPPAAFPAALEEALGEFEIEYLLREFPSAAKETLEGVARVTSIVQAMKAFCHPGATDKAPVDLTRAIENTVTVARNEWKYVAEVVTEFDPDLPHVKCYAAELNQVVLNLIVNAAHAVGEAVGKSGRRGMITIRTLRDDGWAEIRVHDTGLGIPEKIRFKIFKPFFTTKPAGKGTGQGLAIARRVVVEKHGGTIDFTSEEGRGTTFVVRLPIDGELPQPSESPRAATAAS
jgi:signal transduction histidine kinase